MGGGDLRERTLRETCWQHARLAGQELNMPRPSKPRPTGQAGVDALVRSFSSRPKNRYLLRQTLPGRYLLGRLRCAVFKMSTRYSAWLGLRLSAIWAWAVIDLPLTAGWVFNCFARLRRSRTRRLPLSTAYIRTTDLMASVHRRKFSTSAS